MQDVFLGVIAVAVAVMAVMQVATLVAVLRLVRNVDGLVSKIGTELRPLLTDLRGVAADASKVTALVLGQVERVEKLVSDVVTKVEEGVSAFEGSVVGPLRDLLRLLGSLGTTFAGFRRSGPRRESPSAQPDTTEDDDGLFVG